MIVTLNIFQAMKKEFHIFVSSFLYDVFEKALDRTGFFLMAVCHFQVRYQSRKRLADQRPRVRGQFVKQAVQDQGGWEGAGDR